MKKAPISAADRARLTRDAKDVAATAKRKGITMESWEQRHEQFHATQFFELGCWLFYFRNLIYKEGAVGFAHRLACLRVIAESNFTHIGYEFFTCFDFGERQFDTLLEMGDAKELINALRTLAAGQPEYRAMFEHHGWSLPEMVCMPPITDMFQEACL